MANEALRNTNGQVVAEEQLQQLRAGFRGDIIRPGDAGYEDARKIWNAGAAKRPGVIARCSGVADVVAAVNFARSNELLLAIRGGGHNVGGRGLCDGGLVVDLSRMNGVHVDPATRNVRVQGGARLGDMDRETHLFGLAVPAGVVSRTGIGGLALGGGVGWLIRKYGMTIDNVISFQVVTATGAVLTASESENSDLFWALRGGGGNFGVVTSFEFRAHPVSTVLGGLLVYPRSAAREVMQFYRDFMLTAPDELTAYCALLHTPDGTPIVGVIPCYCGDLESGQRVLQPLRSFGSPTMDAIQALPFPAMQSMLDASFPDGNQNYWKSSMHRELSNEAIDAMIAIANKAPSPMSAIITEYYGGAAGRVESSATAFPHRQVFWDVVTVAQWTDPADTAANRDWARAVADALRPFSTGDHLLAALDQDEASGSAFGSNIARLTAIKKKYDPDNFFRVNQNIRPD